MTQSHVSIQLIAAVVVRAARHFLFFRHKFHKECVDEWLIHNRTCPNCHCNILLATGVTIRGIKPTADDEEVGRYNLLSNLSSVACSYGSVFASTVHFVESHFIQCVVCVHFLKQRIKQRRYIGFLISNHNVSLGRICCRKV